MALFANIVDVHPKCLVGIAVHEKPVAMFGRHFSSCDRIAPHEYRYRGYDLSSMCRRQNSSLFYACGSLLVNDWLWREIEIMIAIEPALEVERTLIPDTPKTLNEFGRPFVPFVVLTIRRSTC